MTQVFTITGLCHHCIVSEMSCKHFLLQFKTKTNSRLEISSSKIVFSEVDLCIRSNFAPPKSSLASHHLLTRGHQVYIHRHKRWLLIVPHNWEMKSRQKTRFQFNLFKKTFSYVFLLHLLVGETL